MSHRYGRCTLTIRLTQTHLQVQVAFTVMAIRYPANMPGTLASLNLVQGAAKSFAISVYNMISRSQSIIGQLLAVRDFYEMMNIPNEVPDGVLPLDCDLKEKSGVSLEFRYVLPTNLCDVHSGSF